MFSKGRMPDWGHDPPQALGYRQGELCMNAGKTNGASSKFGKPTASYLNRG